MSTVNLVHQLPNTSQHYLNRSEKHQHVFTTYHQHAQGYNPNNYFYHWVCVFKIPQ